MAKKYKYFYKNGLWPDNEKVFFSAYNSKYYDSRNPFYTMFKIPYEFYKKHFQYNRSAYVYKTELHYSDLRQYAIITYNNKTIFRNGYFV